MTDLDPDAARLIEDRAADLDNGVELIDGEPVEKKMGGESSFVGGRVFHLIARHLDARPLGWALPTDTGYRCFPNRPKHVRKPDASFIRFGRLLGERAPRGDVTIAPDLAVEVVSPNDLYEEVDRKVSEYLDAGVRLVWVVNPDAQTVHIYHPDGTARRLRLPDTLDGADVLPGFSVAVGELLRMPTPPAGAD